MAMRASGRGMTRAVSSRDSRKQVTTEDLQTGHYDRSAGDKYSSNNSGLFTTGKTAEKTPFA